MDFRVVGTKSYGFPPFLDCLVVLSLHMIEVLQ
jgi:hypothetical protein